MYRFVIIKAVEMKKFTKCVVRQISEKSKAISEDPETAFLLSDSCHISWHICCVCVIFSMVSVHFIKRWAIMKSRIYAI